MAADSKRRCQSALLRTRRDTSSSSTIPAWPIATSLTRCWKPSRSCDCAPERPRSLSNTWDVRSASPVPLRDCARRIAAWCSRCSRTLGAGRTGARRGRRWRIRRVGQKFSSRRGCDGGPSRLRLRRGQNGPLDIPIRCTGNLSDTLLGCRVYQRNRLAAGGPVHSPSM